MTGLVYTIVVLLVTVATAVWFSWTATRLDQMHHRIDLGRESLSTQLALRSAVVLELAGSGSLDDAASLLSSEKGLVYRPSAEREHVSGVYRQRVARASGRFAMIADGMGFQLVPWRPALEQRLGRQVAGVMAPGGNIDWSFSRKRRLGI